MKKLTKVLLAFLLGLSLSACSSKKEKVLRVGMECGYAPYNWAQDEEAEWAAKNVSGGYCAGFDVSIAQAIADEAGYELEVVQTDWEGLIPSLTSGRIDFIIAGMSPTAERKESIDFSENYYLSELVIVVEKDGPYANARSLEDLQGARIVAQLGTFHDTVIDQIPSVDHQTPMESFPAMITALNAGRVDGYISEKPGADSAIKSNPNLTYITFEQGQGFTYSEEDAALAVGIKKGNEEMMELCNKALEKITNEQREAWMLEALERQPSSE